MNINASPDNPASTMSARNGEVVRPDSARRQPSVPTRRRRGSHSPARPAITAQRRAVLMCQMRCEGGSLADIGAAFGVTRERARQIIRDAGGPGADEVREIREQRRERERRALRARVLADLERLPGRTAQEVAAGLDTTAEEVRVALGRDAGRLLVVVNDWRQADSDDSLLADLREAGARTPGPLTIKVYRGLFQDFGGRSPALITARFGTWRTACERAGVACGPTMRPAYTRQWTVDQVIEHVADYLAAPDCVGSAGGYEAYARLTPGAPSGPTVRNRVGTWTEVKTRALLRLAQRPTRDRVA